MGLLSVCLEPGGPDLPSTAGTTRLGGPSRWVACQCLGEGSGRRGVRWMGGLGGRIAPAEGCLRLAAISRQRPQPQPARNGAGPFCCREQQDRLWLQKQLQQRVSGRTSTHTHTRTHTLQRGLTGQEVGGQKGQMGIFANATLATDRSHPTQLSLGAKRTANCSGRRVRLG